MCLPLIQQNKEHVTNDENRNRRHKELESTD